MCGLAFSSSSNPTIIENGGMGGFIYIVMCGTIYVRVIRCLKMTLNVKDNQTKNNKVQAKMVKPSNPLFHDGDAVRQMKNKTTSNLP